MKYKVKNALVEIVEIPRTCRDCFAFSENYYQSHNESGTEANCALGFMNKYDARDFLGYRVFEGCKLKCE